MRRGTIVGAVAVAAALAAACASDGDGDEPEGDRAEQATSSSEAPSEAGEERVTSLWAGATIATSGGADVVEVIEWDFAGHRDRHGIYREVPGLDAGAAITAEAEDVPDDVIVEDATFGTDTGTIIRVGSPGVTVSGRHAYTLRFPLEGVLGGGRFAWDAVGTEWGVPVGPVEVHVSSPYELLDVTCAQGPEGATAPCDGAPEEEPGHVTFTVDGLKPHEGVTVAGRVGPPLAEPPAALQPPG
jgi:hypothetical protein